MFPFCEARNCFLIDFIPIVFFFKTTDHVSVICFFPCFDVTFYARSLKFVITNNLLFRQLAFKTCNIYTTAELESLRRKPNLPPIANIGHNFLTKMRP